MNPTLTIGQQVIFARSSGAVQHGEIVSIVGPAHNIHVAISYINSSKIKAQTWRAAKFVRPAKQ